MISVYLTIYFLLSIVIIIVELRCKAGYLRYPFWAALTFGGFALPQFISLAYSDCYSGHSLEKYILMAILCLIVSYFGFREGSRTKFSRIISELLLRRMDARRLRWLSLLYVLIGGAFVVLLYLSGAQFTSQQWDGPWVLYLFFSGFMVFGFVIAADLYLQTGYMLDGALAMFGGMYLMLRTFIHGRRSSAVVLFITVLGLLWFRKRKLFSIWFIVAVVIIGLVISTNMNAYRVAVADKLDFSQLKSINFIGTFLKSFRESEATEVLNGCHVIETADRTSVFDFGLYNWNAAVWTFVPRQLVGKKFKQSLMFPFNVDRNIEHIFGYIRKTGSTLTGIADSYLALSYAGCIKFFVIAFVLGLLYAKAERGSTIAIILYVLSMPEGLLSFTHGTHEFSNSMILLGTFLMPGLVFSSISDCPAHHRISIKRWRIVGRSVRNR